jgi:hypothetical protein
MDKLMTGHTALLVTSAIFGSIANALELVRQTLNEMILVLSARPALGELRMRNEQKHNHLLRSRSIVQARLLQEDRQKNMATQQGLSLLSRMKEMVQMQSHLLWPHLQRKACHNSHRGRQGQVPNIYH